MINLWQVTHLQLEHARTVAMILLHAPFILLYPLPSLLSRNFPSCLYHSLYHSLCLSLPSPSLFPCLLHSLYHFLFPPSFYLFVTLYLPNFLYLFPSSLTLLLILSLSLHFFLHITYSLSPTTLFLYSRVSFLSLSITMTITTSHN